MYVVVALLVVTGHIISKGLPKKNLTKIGHSFCLIPLAINMLEGIGPSGVQKLFCAISWC